ncbi:AraC family transcriptional regulator [Candidatus Sulfopaludibacter sp. SbA3]|nr:AraC family transcriptional regulator [Candidatus Sulfopaludibacter sp. SbA3]
MAKIAVEKGGVSTRPTARLLAKGDGWSVSEVVCTLGPRDRPFEERHGCPSIAMVVAGTFQYRSRSGRELMTPGSLMLGSTNQCFECGHEHETGDRCVSFSYTQEFFERLAADSGSDAAGSGFKMLRLPPVRGLSPLIAQASAALSGSGDAPWEELTIQLAAKAVQLDRGLSGGPASAEPGALARVTRVLRMVERHPGGSHTLRDLAREARLSPYHFLRTFQRLTGVTPHQYLLRARLRTAATRLITGRVKILDLALDSGFGDISNFNRTFRAEFGVSPRAYRAQAR